MGEPIMVGERTIQPVARVAGWHGQGGSGTPPRIVDWSLGKLGTNRQSGGEGGSAGAWLCISPVEVIVRESNGTEYRVSITDPAREAIRGIVLSALLVAAVCWLLMLILRRKTSAN